MTRSVEKNPVALNINTYSLKDTGFDGKAIATQQTRVTLPRLEGTHTVPFGLRGEKVIVKLRHFPRRLEITSESLGQVDARLPRLNGHPNVEARGRSSDGTIHVLAEFPQTELKGRYPKPKKS